MTTKNTKMNPNWEERIFQNASKWSHTICAITGTPPKRRSKVLWFCNNHPSDGTRVFQENDSGLNQLLQENLKNNALGLSKEQIEKLILLYPGQQFYMTRVDEYLSPTRKKCCYYGMLEERKEFGFETFKQLLNERSVHYKTKYKLLFSVETYKGKLEKHRFICVSHNKEVNYSMQDLNYCKSCPCPECRRDPKHKNTSVEIVKRRNEGRFGRVVRHAQRVKDKYNNACALSGSTFDLQHHHLDGQDFYQVTALEWNSNGICLCGTIHRDFHYNFLKNYSIIALTYTDYSFNEMGDLIENVSSEKYKNNPDYILTGAEVSRYTFLEYLKFLIFDINSNDSRYVNVLNQKIEKDYYLFQERTQSSSLLKYITLETLKIAIQKYCLEYKGQNWALSSRPDISFANNTDLWKKVDYNWQ